MRSNTKRGEIQNIVITFILVAMVITGTSLWFGALVTTYPDMSADDDFSGVYNSSAGIYQQVHSLQNGTQEVRENPSLLQGIEQYSAVLGVIWGLPDFIRSLLTALFQAAGVPQLAEFIPFIELMFLVIGIFAILNWLRGGASKL